MRLAKAISRIDMNGRRALVERIRSLGLIKVKDSLAYPFKVHDPREVFENVDGVSRFRLVGDNWLLGKDKPIAVLWGFNDWKLGFVADYLCDYRTAFAPRKITSISAFYELRKLPSADIVHIAWGYNEPLFVRRVFGKKIIRVEDGFIRSAALGASHSTPYSLAIDRKALYLNCHQPSDLEDLLQTYVLPDDAVFKSKVTRALQLYRDLEVTKYKPHKSDSSVRIRPRRTVAVIGQVPGDKSIIYGNPDKWSTEELIALAVAENPGCTILYRPHPDVYYKHRKGRTYSKFGELVEVVEPTIPFVQFLKEVDQVYTISSLAGFDALLNGVKVTTVGFPFYAGWGLTDDRVTEPEIRGRRTRRLSLEELFAISILVYPEYLANKNDKFMGFVASAFRIEADQFLNSYRQVANAPSEKEALSKHFLETVSDGFWPVFLKHEDSVKVFNEHFSKVNIGQFINAESGSAYKKLFFCLVMGRLQGDDNIRLFMGSFRNFVSLEEFQELVELAGAYRPSLAIPVQVSWIEGENFRTDESIQILNRAISDVQTLGKSNPEERSEQLTRIIENLQSNQVLTTEVAAFYRAEFDALVKDCKLAQAFDVALILCICGHWDTRFVLDLISLLSTSFDNVSAQSLAVFHQAMCLVDHNRTSTYAHILNNLDFSSRDGMTLLLRNIALDVSQNPERINNIYQRLKEFMKPVFPEFKEYLYSLLRTDRNLTNGKAIGYCYAGDFEKAGLCVQELLLNKPDDVRFISTFATVLQHQGRQREALKILGRLEVLSDSASFYSSYIRDLTTHGLFEEALTAARNAAKKGIEISNELILPIHLGLGRIEEGYRLYNDVPTRETVRRCFGDSYFESNETVPEDLVLLPSYGPGDEIRFASIYPDLFARFGAERFSVVVDTRLHPLMKRSFPTISFIPSRRVSQFAPDILIDNYTHLPTSELTRIFDNNAYDEARRHKSVKMLTDYISTFRKRKSDFPGKGYLKCDEGKKDAYRERLKSDGSLFVGISWRSHLTDYRRNINYLDVEQLRPLFDLDLDGLVFVNLQYDDIVEEKQWIESRFPGKFIDFEDVDQFADFDEVAGLMSALDLIIAPPTTVVEMAGALGLETLLISNHGQLNWRKTDTHGVDVWQNLIRHVSGAYIGDKEGLVENLVQEIRELHAQRRSGAPRPGAGQRPALMSVG